MTTRRTLMLLAAGALARPARAQSLPEADAWRTALPGYRYSFPGDHLDHPEFRTEWWYFTGNLRAGDGRAFGYELTFFRQGREGEVAASGSWHTRLLYLAHLALSDINGGRFHHRERLNRAGPGLAGVHREQGLIWNGNWNARLTGEHGWRLHAVDPAFTLQLDLQSLKAPVLHGRDGVHQKAEGAGRASHYISLTRLQSTGELVLDGRTYALSGLSWMDHEFFSNLLAEDQTGWDWFSIQFENGTELMLYQLRRRDGSTSSAGGTFVDREGNLTALAAGDLQLQAQEYFRSASTGANYPIGWNIAIPRLDLELRAKPKMREQELVSTWGIGPSYWEGAMDFEGTMQGGPITGSGYLELTGYAGEVNLGDRPHSGRGH